MSLLHNTSIQENLFREDDYFFLIDSDHLQDATTKLFGYAVEEAGIFENHNVDQWGQDCFHGIGTYVFIKRKQDQVVISQDFNGGMGLYIYRNGDYYAISNSFFKLVRYLKDKKRLTPNMDYMKTYLSTWITTVSYQNTPIKEITMVPSHAVLSLNSNDGLQMRYIDYALNTVPINSPEGIQLLDAWHRKWKRIIRKTVEKSDRVMVDLSGGFDSRLTFLFFLQNGLDLSKVLVHSINDRFHTHDEDFQIATEISNRYGFSLSTDYKAKPMCLYSAEDILNLNSHIRMMFHKEFSFASGVHGKKQYHFGGFGGETIRPYWDMSLEKMIEKQYSYVSMLPDKTYREYTSSISRILFDSYHGLEEKYGLFDEEDNTYGFAMFREVYNRCHFGKISTEAYTTNTLNISPIMDPLLQKIRLNDDTCRDKNLLIALIFERYNPELLSFPFEGGRSISEETRKHARDISSGYPMISEDESSDALFLLDDSVLQRISTNVRTSPSEINDFFLEIFHSPSFQKSFSCYFGQAFYDFIETTMQSKYYPLRYVIPAVGCMEIMDIVVANKTALTTGVKESLENLACSYSCASPAGIGGNRTSYDALRPRCQKESYKILEVYTGDEKRLQEQGKNTPKVSVVVPIYNVEDYLEHALETLQKQTLHEMEFICVNDGSTDSSLEIAKSFAENDPRFIIVDKKNGGYGIAMNTGIALAKGMYVGILEPDDYVALDMFEELYKTATKENLDYVKADFYRFITEDDGTIKMKYEHLDKTNRCYNKVVDPSHTPELCRMIMNTWAGIYKRSFLIENDIRHNTTPGASFQDNGFFWLTTVYAHRAMFLDKPYYMNRRNNPNSSVKSVDKVYAANVEYDWIRKNLLQDPEIWDRFCSFYYLKRFHNIDFTLSRISPQFKREYIERSSAEFARAKDLGELDYSAFYDNEKERLKFLIGDAEGFYYMQIDQQYKKLYEDISKSISFRIGRLITYIPRKFRDLFRP